MALPRSVLLIISGSVAAYKSLELIRLLKAENVVVTAILTQGGAAFITPLAVSSLTGTPTYGELFSLTDETAMGHIALSRSAEAVLVAPASADILAKMAAGLADDLASTALLATDAPVIVAPAMNPNMWAHPATQRNLAQLAADGVQIIPPTEGTMACGETGLGRFAEPTEIVAWLHAHFRRTKPALLAAPTELQPAVQKLLPHGAALLKGKRAVVTSGPTLEPIDPVRFIGNRSSGKQGHAIAAALAAAGAEVTLIAGATDLPAPEGVRVISAPTADAMREASLEALPVDIFVAAAAVADWRMTHVSPHKIKKHGTRSKLTLELLPTQDILQQICKHAKRPALVVGFAAETEHLVEHAQAKRLAKGCDWIVANDVSGNVFGGEQNEVHLITESEITAWPRLPKTEVAALLVEKIVQHFAADSTPKKSKKKA